jgi:hypothetical protein
MEKKTKYIIGISATTLLILIIVGIVLGTIFGNKAKKAKGESANEESNTDGNSNTDGDDRRSVSLTASGTGTSTGGITGNGSGTGVLISTVTGSSTVNTTPAVSYIPPADTKIIYNPALNLCMGGSRNNSTHMATCGYTDDQNWVIESVSGDRIAKKFRNVKSNRCLANLPNYFLDDCSAVNTKFYPEQLAGNFKFRTGTTCLYPSVNNQFGSGTGIVNRDTCSGHASQQWKIINQLAPENQVKVVNANNKVLKMGTPDVVLGDGTYPMLETWKELRVPGSNMIKLRNTASELCLADTPRFFDDCKNTTSNWVREENRLKSPTTHKCLIANSANNLVMDNCTTNSQGQWNLVNIG